MPPTAVLAARSEGSEGNANYAPSALRMKRRLFMGFVVMGIWGQRGIQRLMQETGERGFEPQAADLPG